MLDIDSPNTLRWFSRHQVASSQAGSDPLTRDGFSRLRREVSLTNRGSPRLCDVHQSRPSSIGLRQSRPDLSLSPPITALVMDQSLCSLGNLGQPELIQHNTILKVDAAGQDNQSTGSNINSGNVVQAISCNPLNTAERPHTSRSVTQNRKPAQASALAPASLHVMC